MTVHVFNHRLSPPHLNYLAPQQQRAAKRCLRHFTSLVFGRRRGDFPLKPPCLRARNLLASSGAWKIAPGPLVPLADKHCRASGAVSFSARPPPPGSSEIVNPTRDPASSHLCPLLQSRSWCAGRKVGGFQSQTPIFLDSGKLNSGPCAKKRVFNISGINS